ncbi:MAG: crossover junction endodeoxyribonuclease RuvC [Limnochordia bacterium]
MEVILGIDPGTALTGYGVVASDQRKLHPLTYGVIRTRADLDQAQRLRQIYDALEALIDKYHPGVVVVEQLFFNKNIRSALAVGQARGVAILAGAQAGLPVEEYTPLQVKQALTGQGRADKEQVAYMVKILLGLRETPKPDDVTDALAVAITHAHLGGTLALWERHKL